MLQVLALLEDNVTRSKAIQVCIQVVEAAGSKHYLQRGQQLASGGGDARKYLAQHLREEIEKLVDTDVVHLAPVYEDKTDVGDEMAVTWCKTLMPGVVKDMISVRRQEELVRAIAVVSEKESAGVALSCVTSNGGGGGSGSGSGGGSGGGGGGSSGGSSDSGGGARASTVRAAARMEKELEHLTHHPPEGCHVMPCDTRSLVWRVVVLGPDDTPYEGGVFTLEFIFSELYPLRPPQVLFVTPIYHCNVAENGEVCHDLLQEKWSPAMGVEAILLGIISLLKGPNPEVMTALRPGVAELFTKNRAEHDKKAVECTVAYAKGGVSA
jgi:ubiquitin-conjugating enzyme E2 D/E